VRCWSWRSRHHAPLGRIRSATSVDLEAGRPVDLLPDRSAPSLAAWLKLIKRQGYGRAGLDTFKRRFLRVA